MKMYPGILIISMRGIDVAREVVASGRVHRWRGRGTSRVSEHNRSA